LLIPIVCSAQEAVIKDGQKIEGQPKVQLEIEAYKSEYDLTEPLILLYRIVVKHGHRYSFCLYPKDYVFSIKVLDQYGNTVTKDKGFQNDGMAIKEKRPITANSYFDFVSVGVVPAYKPHIGYISVNDFWSNITDLESGKYWIIVKLSPYITKYFWDKKTVEVENAWTGTLISAPLPITIVELKSGNLTRQEALNIINEVASKRFSNFRFSKYEITYNPSAQRWEAHRDIKKGFILISVHDLTKETECIVIK
jgi:hypothetical protein